MIQNYEDLFIDKKAWFDAKYQSLETKSIPAILHLEMKHTLAMSIAPGAPRDMLHPRVARGQGTC